MTHKEITQHGDTFIIETANVERDYLQHWYKGFLQGAGVHPALWFPQVDGSVKNMNIDKSTYSDEQILRSGQKVYEVLTKQLDFTETDAISYLEGFFDGIQFSKDTKHK